MVFARMIALVALTAIVVILALPIPHSWSVWVNAAILGLCAGAIGQWINLELKEIRQAALERHDGES